MVGAVGAQGHAKQASSPSSMPPSLKPSPTRRCGRAPWTKASIFPHGTSRRRRRSLPFRRQRSRNGGRSSRRRASKASDPATVLPQILYYYEFGDDDRFGSFASLRRAVRLRRMSAMPSIATELCVATNRRDVPKAAMSSAAAARAYSITSSARARNVRDVEPERLGGDRD